MEATLKTIAVIVSERIHSISFGGIISAAANRVL